MTIGTVANLVQKGMYGADALPEQTAALTAAGTVQTDALVLAANKDVYIVGTTALNTGVRLPAPTAVGDTILVVNQGANSLKIYGAGTHTINGVATATGISVATLKAALLFATSLSTWVAVYA